VVQERTPGTAASKRLPGILPGTYLDARIRIACIHADTHYPFLLQNGFDVKTYAVVPLSTREQKLPKQLREYVETIVNANKALLAPFARP
jgi:hypothetical protein